MLLKNTATQQGLVNGGLGTVAAITLSDTGSPTKIHVTLDSNGSTVAITRSHCKYTVLGHRLVSKRTFPLILAYAMTGHKAQGATIRGHLILDIHSAFTCGLVYTMLTRATQRSNLMIIGNITPAMLTAVPDFHADE